MAISLLRRSVSSLSGVWGVDPIVPVFVELARSLWVETERGADPTEVSRRIGTAARAIAGAVSRDTWSPARTQELWARSAL